MSVSFSHLPLLVFVADTHLVVVVQYYEYFSKLCFMLEENLRVNDLNLNVVVFVTVIKCISIKVACP